MAEAELERILADARARWPGAALAARHRLGIISVAEASVAVAAACPHRGAAFDACRFVIEEIKRRVPIWKREVFEDGSRAWRANAGTAAPPSPAG
jgi:molybdopterin synthase catalytic subunit